MQSNRININMKHTLKFKDLFTLPEKIICIVTFFLFFSLGIFFYMSNTLGGFVLIVLSAGPTAALFYKNATKKISKVYRIERTDKVSRLVVEYWLKADVLNLDQRFFWMVNGKYIPILQFSNKKDKDFMPIYPFDDPDPRVTAGHLARSLVQSAAEILMTPEKNEKFEALKTGGLMLLAGGGALLIIALMGNIQGGAA